mgnify:CR=1 FL=1
MLPTDQAVTELHKKYAPSEEVLRLVYTHSEIVRDIALELIDASHLDVDRELVRIGAMLHDIGVYPLFSPDGVRKEGVKYITHGIEGEKLLRREGFSEVLCRFAAHHTGVGLTRQDIITQELPLPGRDYVAETDEELLVMYADKFHSKSTPPQFNTAESYRAWTAQFGNDTVKRFDRMVEKFGTPDLQRYSAQYGFEIK